MCNDSSLEAVADSGTCRTLQSASEFVHSNGSRQAGSIRAIHQQRDANTRISESNSDDRNTATASGKLCMRSNAKDSKKRTETMPSKSKP